MKSDLIDAFYVLVKHALSTTAAVSRTGYSFSLGLLYVSYLQYGTSFAPASSVLFTSLTMPSSKVSRIQNKQRTSTRQRMTSQDVPMFKNDPARLEF